MFEYCCKYPNKTKTCPGEKNCKEKKVNLINQLNDGIKELGGVQK